MSNRERTLADERLLSDVLPPERSTAATVARAVAYTAVVGFGLVTGAVIGLVAALYSGLIAIC